MIAISPCVNMRDAAMQDFGFLSTKNITNLLCTESGTLASICTYIAF